MTLDGLESEYILVHKSWLQVRTTFDNGWLNYTSEVAVGCRASRVMPQMEWEKLEDPAAVNEADLLKYVTEKLKAPKPEQTQPAQS